MSENMIKKRINNLDLYDELLKFDTLGERLRYLRKIYKEMTMKELSKELNIAQSYIYLYENNEVRPRPERFQDIAKFYDVDINVLDPKQSNSLSLNEFEMIHTISNSLWYEINLNKKNNITKFDYSNITITICDSLLFIISILEDKNKKEFFEYFVNSLLIDTKELEASEEAIISYINDLKLKAKNFEITTIHLDYLFRPVEYALFYKFFNQLIFNKLIKILLPLIEIFF